MSIKMIVTDLDGTLLRTDKTVSERNRLALSHCRELGIKVVFATGRSYRTKIVPQDWFDGYIRSNGAYAYADDIEVYHSGISEEVMHYILDACNLRHIAAEPRAKADIVLRDLLPEDAEYVNSILPADLYLIVLKDKLGQIMHVDATKGKAAEALARHFGINQSDVVAFGDDLNDKDLLSWASIGVAMGNALDEVKAVADFICDTNDNDGVAKWLEENILCR